jgi:SNF2 family DNA or RNA helicase
MQMEMNENDKEEFWKFQSSHLNIDCLGPKLSHSFKDLEFADPTKPRVGNQQGHCLLPFQVTRLQYLIEHERDPFPISEQFGLDDMLKDRKFAYLSSLVADDPGLSKTVMTLALIAWTTIYLLPNQINKPTIVVCPGGVVNY